MPNRSVRVFVSSTFRDMHAERDELIRRVFPRLREICQQRGVGWGEVDLRWGATDELAAEEKILPICLEEIDRCRPFFIGILGECYGWIPRELSPDLIDDYPWLTKSPDCSVTELEMQYGVLQNPQMAMHGFFYFRDPAFHQSLQGAQKMGLSAQDLQSAEKLRRLKDRIRASGVPVRDNYLNPRSLGELVFRDIAAAIDRLFPNDKALNPLDHEAMAHDSFARNLTRGYVHRSPAYQRRLDHHINSDDPPLVVTGESGAGKSSLLADWALRHQASHPADFLIFHFIGATPGSTNIPAMLRRIMGELKRAFSIAMEIPGRPSFVDLKAAFIDWLAAVSDKGRIILIIDALNYLENHAGVVDMSWMPPLIPGNIRMIVSTRAGRSIAGLDDRDWPMVQVGSLEHAERTQLIKAYMNMYSKSLNSERIGWIAAAQATSNPRYLCTFLNEIRVGGSRAELLGEKIQHYLRHESLESLYEVILDRWEQDYETERPGLVRDAMLLLLKAKEGLSPIELLHALGSEGHPLPQVHWAPLELAASDSLLHRSDTITFSNDDLPHAVERKYSNPEEHNKAHRSLAKVFHSRLFGSLRFIGGEHPDLLALRFLPYHAYEGREATVWITTMTDFAFLQSTVAFVNVGIGMAASGEKISWHEGYFVIEDELKRWLSLPLEDDYRELIEPLSGVWERHQNFVKSGDAIMPTLYRELNSLEPKGPGEVLDRSKRRFVLKGGPLWTWCERERGKYEDAHFPWSPRTREQSESAIDAEGLVFISVKTPDYEYGLRVHDFLTANGISTFLSRESLPQLGDSDYRKTIDRALDQARHMVVVASSGKNVTSSWVEAEWGFFINEKRSGRKTGNIITVVAGTLKPSALPPSLRYYEVIPYGEKSLATLLGYVVG